MIAIHAEHFDVRVGESASILSTGVSVLNTGFAVLRDSFGMANGRAEPRRGVSIVILIAGFCSSIAFRPDTRRLHKMFRSDIHR